MTPDGQLLSADSFQLLMSDGSSSSSLLQAEDIQALLSASSPTAVVGNSPPGPPPSAVDHHRHLGTPEPNKRVEMASLGLPETAEHRHLAVSSFGVPHSADNQRMVVTSSTMPNTANFQRFESPTCPEGHVRAPAIVYPTVSFCRLEEGRTRRRGRSTTRPSILSPSAVQPPLQARAAFINQSPRIIITAAAAVVVRQQQLHCGSVNPHHWPLSPPLFPR
jgi:hypothetical protein